MKELLQPGATPPTPPLSKPINEQAEQNMALLQLTIQHKFQTERGLSAGKEALIHSSASNISDGNLRLARLGEAAMKTSIIERLYLQGRATGENVASALDNLTINNLARISKEKGVDKLLVVGGPKPAVSDKMAAHLLQAICGAVYLDVGLDGLKSFMEQQGL